MSARLEKIEKSEAHLNIEVDAQTFEEGLQKAYKKVVKQVAIPGFRKGRVPRELLEAHFGREILFEDAVEMVVPGAFEEALKELNIDPIAQPEFEIEEIKEDNILKFRAIVPVKPEFELGQIEGLEVSIPILEMDESDVDRRMEDMAAHYAQLVEKTDEPAEMGDTATIDFEGYIDDVAFEGGAGEDYPLELGSHSFIPGFEEQVVGLKVGDTADVLVKFPDGYHAEELAGKNAVFKVTVHKIETKQARELNDEFAQEVSNFDNIAELRDDVRKNLETSMENHKKSLIRDAVLQKILESNQFDVPGAIVKMQLQTMLNQFAEQLKMQGLSIEQYFQLTGRNVDRFNEEMWPEGEKNARTNFVLEKIVEEKGIELSDEELDNQIVEIATSMGMEPDQAKQNLAGVMEDFTYRLKIQKAIDYLVDNAVVTETAEEDEAETVINEEPEA
ncbi:MAG: Cell division trigger factor [Firmicutes bacterium]|nr:Cell division trigger factor [Bacillota bacterium]